ncbi:uncharacterized protein LOC111519440 [Drosophila willistoni]|uniref:uncharacterized protein LOC111519440 n=1 Tax=Drosophila willistoni TaxID=7260 RepID=UPI000C26CBD1|nr:uncharacterized protein LOC111519440 [Drosophila willistoni]
MLIGQIAFLLLACSYAVYGRQDTPSGKSLSCQQNGGYCQTHWECCSGKCMTYQYVCAALAAPPTYQTEKPSQSLCQRNWHYCEHDGDCCSAKCIPFYNICAAGNSYPFPYINPNSLQQNSLINSPKDELQIVTLATENKISTNPRPSPSPSDSKEKATSLYEIVVNKPATTAKPRQCHQIGEECYTSDQCCSQRCLFYSHKCVH